MTPLGMVVAGLVLVVVDFRYNGFDLVPDLVGWAVVLGGLVKLLARSRWFAAAAIAAAGGIAIGLPLLVAEPGRLLGVGEGAGDGRRGLRHLQRHPGPHGGVTARGTMPT